MVVVMGFGRSGTTWLSDIISKCMGGLLLFEPLHPSVDYTISKKYAYSTKPDDELKSFLVKVLNKEVRKDWLLRSHVPSKLEQVSKKIKENIWKSCTVFGMKNIRTNFMIDWFYENFPCKIVYIKRDVFSVVSSIIRRNFWEFGWPETYELFIKRTENHVNVKDYPDLESRIASMWCITELLVKPDNRTFFVNYEDLYLDSFNITEKILEYLGVKTNIHPSFIYTPSNTSFGELLNYNENISISKKFRKIDEYQKDRIRRVLSDYGVTNTFYEE